MLRYYRKDLIIAIIIALCVSAAIMAFWSWAVGFNVLFTYYGLASAVVIVFVTLYIALSVARRIVDGRVLRIVNLYNDQCDPQAFKDASEKLASKMTAPVLEPGGWFLSYLGQASLDLGDSAQAHEALQTILTSADGTQNPRVCSALLTNAIPLLLKLEGPQRAAEAIDEALTLIAEDPRPHAMAQRSFLRSQRQLCEELIHHDDSALLERYRSVRRNESMVLRVRVEYAWDEARIDYDLGLKDDELECLRFIAQSGHGLAFAPLAAKRLEQLEAR